MIVSGLTIAIAPRTQGTSDKAKQTENDRIVEVRSFRCSPAKHIDLLPQDQDFYFQRCSRLEERSQTPRISLNSLHQIANLPRLFSASILNRIFGTHSILFPKTASTSAVVKFRSNSSGRRQRKVFGK